MDVSNNLHIDDSNNKILIQNDNSDNEVVSVIYNLTGIKDDNFNIFFQDVFQQNWGVKMEEVINNDKMNIYLGFFTDEVNEIMDQYDNIIINDIIESERIESTDFLENSEEEYEINDEEDIYYKKFSSCKQINEIIGKSEKIKKDDELIKNKSHCFICLNEFKENELKRKLKCNHYFHKKCIDKWLKISARCPICRKKYL